MEEKNFVLTVENDDSPIIITVPHGGMTNLYASWLDVFFKKRVKNEDPEENIVKGERIVLEGDSHISHLVGDILKKYPANLITGLLPRAFVDYNRFVPEVAYADEKVKPFYDAYHIAISNAIERLKKNPMLKDNIFLFDFHGFGKQPIENRQFDIILGTNGESCPSRADKFMYDYFKGKYQIFCAGVDGLPEESEFYKGDTTNLFYYKKYGIQSLLVEVAPKFRSSKIENSKENGIKLAEELANYFKKVDSESRGHKTKVWL